MLYRSLSLFAFVASQSATTTTAFTVTKDCSNVRSVSALSMLPAAADDEHKRETSLSAHGEIEAPSVAKSGKINEYSDKDKFLLQSMGLSDDSASVDSTKDMESTASKRPLINDNKQSKTEAVKNMAKTMRSWISRNIDSNQPTTGKKNGNTSDPTKTALSYLEMAEKQRQEKPKAKPQPLVSPEAAKYMNLAHKLNNVNNSADPPPGLQYSRFLRDRRAAERMMGETKLMIEEEHKSGVLLAEQMFASSSNNDWEMETSFQ